jgi:uncharacterized protein YdhG (YjbR/CyaY superfamily)
MKRNSESPAAYLKELADDEREIVERIRRLIHEIEPKMVEGMQYGMLDFPGLANLAAQKNYVALYVVPEVLARHKKHFPGVDAGKSCLRFKRIEQADPERIKALLNDVRDHRKSGSGV